ncbi:unnamed protein product [Peronospora belbahrii]|uniref:FYVE-type domain-containing protein n=1 Tax=Peronospora belbahrii TaxID=622444 RepID=A0AAU9L1R8_9STRA|nr:unnamed protein product [Peronospora belbahrii]CAH0518553.1 unnamed protein product [Peronospora belbahrii]
MHTSPSVKSGPAFSWVADDDLPPDSKPSMRSPLPVEHFNNVHVSQSKRQEYKDLVRQRVSSMLADEHRYMERRAQQHPVVQHTEWKLLRRIRDFKVYKRRFQGRSRQDVAAEEELPEVAIAVERGNPVMLVDGMVSGTIEDMLYGMSATTQEEMMTGFSITASPEDAALLSIIEHSTVEDPLRSAELLWVLSKFPILNSRDVCFLKATGVGRDGKGVPYGYMVLHSVDVPECPPFDYRKTKILRAKMFFSFLFRESSPGSLNVIGRGIFDLAGGEMLKLVLPHATALIIDGLLKSSSCGEAKKLTLLACQNSDERRKLKALSKKSVCSMCIRGNGRVLPGTRLRLCEVCGVPICKSCTIKNKRMFTGTRKPWHEATCCATCSQQAKRITGVRLGDPDFLVVAEFYSNKSHIPSSSSLSCSAVAVKLATPSPEASTKQDMVDYSPAHSIEEGKHDAAKTTSSIVVTNSTIDDSCADFDFNVSFSSTLSGVNSGECRLHSSAYFHRNVDLVEKLEPRTGVSVDLLKEYAELGDFTEEKVSSGVQAWNESYTVDVDKFTKEGCTVDTDDSLKPSRPTNMVEWMMELQTSAEQAFITAKANEEIMKKAMR